MIHVLSFELESVTPLKSGSASHSREDVLARFNDFCEELVDEKGASTYSGITEGVMLSEEAHERGYETESWVLDSGMAPHERDWLSHEASLTMTAYFLDESSAKKAASWLSKEYQFKISPKYSTEEEQDWNATWKAAFTGIDVGPNLKVLPPWSEAWAKAKASGNTKGIIAINPGAGFGTGTHETTQLCLQILTGLGDLTGKVVLDFGSGSGILGIMAAVQGAKVYCVEIDPLANDNAVENAALNGVSNRIQFLTEIPAEIKGGKVDILLANILRPILLQMSPVIRDCLKPQAELVLSGLIESDLPSVIDTYQSGREKFTITTYEKNEWRALWLRK